MCSSKPKIPNSKTPPAPNAPEATPDAPTISDRGQWMRGRGFKIEPRPDLSGLGNQKMDTPTAANQLRIGAGTSTVRSQAEIDAAFAAQQAAELARQNRRPVAGTGWKGLKGTR